MRAGENLRGDHAAIAREGLFDSRRFWSGFLGTLALLIAASAAASVLG